MSDKYEPNDTEVKVLEKLLNMFISVQGNKLELSFEGFYLFLM